MFCTVYEVILKRTKKALYLRLFHFNKKVFIPSIFRGIPKGIIHLTWKKKNRVFLYELHYFELPPSSCLV